MAEYIACVMGDDGHIVSFWAFICDGDLDATVWAKRLADSHDVELRSGEHVVTRIRAKKSEPPRRPTTAGRNNPRSAQ